MIWGRFEQVILHAQHWKLHSVDLMLLAALMCHDTHT